MNISAKLPRWFTFPNDLSFFDNKMRFGVSVNQFVAVSDEHNRSPLKIAR